MNVYSFPQQVAWKTLNLLIERNGLIRPVGIAFYVWSLPERVVVAFDPEAIALDKVDDGFAHKLSTRLHGRKVVRTNSRGVFFQVGLNIPPAQVFEMRALDFSKQETPWHIPVGMLGVDNLWISLMEADSILIAGSRGSGKSGEVHGMIQALLRGGKTDIYASDGKRGAEFGRYMESQNFHFMANARQGLEALSNQLAGRLDLLRESGYPNILTHNQAGQDFITPVAIVVDEIAELDDATKELIRGMVKLYRAAGLYPILATNDPVQSSILVKTNLATRICFRVPSWNDSLTVLGAKGAEELPQTEAGQPGRGLVVWRGKLTEFQAYRVDFPMPSETARRMLACLYSASNVPSSVPNAIAELAESIRERWQPGMSGRAVGELLNKQYGGSWKTKIDEIMNYLSATTTTPPASRSILRLEGAL